MDEPTAALGVAETARVEKIIGSLKARSMPILIISHSLDQVFRLRPDLGAAERQADRHSRNDQDRQERNRIDDNGPEHVNGGTRAAI